MIVHLVPAGIGVPPGALLCRCRCLCQPVPPASLAFGSPYRGDTPVQDGWQLSERTSPAALMTAFIKIVLLWAASLSDHHVTGGWLARNPLSCADGPYAGAQLQDMAHTCASGCTWMLQTSCP
jgi:hypothetical protein